MDPVPMAAGRTEVGGRGAVKSAERTLAVIELVARRDGVTLSEIADALTLPRSSAHGLLRTMVSADWLRLDEGGRYRLGVRAWLVGRSAGAYAGMLDPVRGVLARATAATGETCQFVALDGTDSVYLAISESPHPMRLFSHEGSRLRAHATAVGRAMLSALPAVELDDLLTGLAPERFTEHTVTDPAALRALVDRARSDGYATEQNEYVVGSTCVAAAVGTADEVGLTCGISITTPSFRQPADWPGPQLAALRAAVDEVRGILRG
ncbi:IclR family transcriptional regulator [Enemella evansiae]|uniref:Glycerol operon regulatory protein n=1 Tax=Enemella evansiae TaxID=2016499 RepID=A0A255GLM0_9ACTN|nr:IclR family transcriptional regulator [Enemella evansiae]OYO16461.1 IclR family transcriptional regulator [Enemella evansiae]